MGKVLGRVLRAAREPFAREREGVGEAAGG